MKKKQKRKKKSNINKGLMVWGAVFAVVVSVVFSLVYIIKNDTGGQVGTPIATLEQGATTLVGHCEGVCHQFKENPEDIVIHFNGDIMVSGAGTHDGNTFPKEKSKSVDIPAGEYTVMLESFDSFDGREEEAVVDQDKEQYYVIFKDGSSEIGRSGTTGDLEDEVEEAMKKTFVNNEDNRVILSKDVDKITVVHAGPSSESLKHGFEPVCMLLQKQKEKKSGISIKKSVSKSTVKVGTKVTYTYKVKNDGEVELTDVKVKDDKLGSITCPESKLKKGASMTCTKSAVITKKVTNIGTVTAKTSSDKTVKDTDSAKVSIESEKEPDCDASIGNYIWYDTNGNGKQDSIEEGISGLDICAHRGNKKYCDTTGKNGKYEIDDLCEGSYSVVVGGVGKMVQTYDPDGKKDNKTKVKLDEGEKHTKADFGYRGAAPKTGVATNMAVLVGVSTLITLGILIILKKKGSL